MDLYGYKINLRDKKMRELYERFKKWKGIPKWCPLSDNERFEFENYIIGGKSNAKEKLP